MLGVLNPKLNSALYNTPLTEKVFALDDEEKMKKLLATLVQIIRNFGLGFE
ncbi:MAG: hypothetical protein M9887_08930 [Chitinophagales bacterium]|nr:hypothetical protein [Chitinophagales bacterium]